MISDDVYAVACQHHDELLKMMSDVGFGMEPYTSREFFSYYLLMTLGIGEYDYDSLTWSPTSDQIYVLDAEVFNVGAMYTEFMQGVQSIVHDAQFTHVAEDLSGMTASWNPDGSDGYRFVGFLCNGRPYSIRLTSYGDWLNPEIIDFVNDALQKEGCSGQLHIISEDYDQMVFLIYGSEKDADALRRVIATAPYGF